MNTLPNTLSPALATGRQLAKARELRDQAVAAFESPWVAYPLLLALQLKVIWGLWAVLDVTNGDTGGYFTYAWRWFTEGRLQMAFSPLYSAFYGSLLFINPDPVWATAAHRVILVLVSGALVLAVFRRLLSPAVAWLCAAWWAVLPVAFNTMYEVHLFTVPPVLVVWLLMATARGPARRAAGLAVLGASVVLVRNELSVPFALLATVLVGWEWRAARQAADGRRAALSRAAGWYASALLVAALVCYAGYERAILKYPELGVLMKKKHTFNMGQVYAFGHRQRHPEWPHNPWTDYELLMAETFGMPDPTLGQMLTRNPAAAWEHISWNMELAPNGLQFLMFGATSGRGNPDYLPDAEIPLGRTTPLYLSVAAGLLWGLGLVVLWRQRRDVWAGRGSGRALCWLAIFAVVAVTPLLITTQRPRASYLLVQGIAVMGATGALFGLVVNRWGLGERLRQAMPVVMVGLVFAVPSYYKAMAKSNEKRPTRQVVTALQRLEPHRAEIVRPGCLFIDLNGDVQRYFHPGGPAILNGMLPLRELLERCPKGETLPAFLARLEVDYVYVDEQAYSHVRQSGRSQRELGFFSQIVPSGWERIDGDSTPGKRWQLIRRAPHAAPLLPPVALTQFPQDLDHPELRCSGITEDGWMSKTFSAVLTKPEGGSEFVFRGEVLARPGAPEFRTELTVLIDGAEVTRRVLTSGPFEVRLPARGAPGPRAIECRFSHDQQHPAPDPRITAAHLSFLGFEPKK